MKNFFSLTLGLSLLILCFAGCEKKSNPDTFCNQITLNKPFIGKINEQWCLNESDWKIRFGPFIEDSRCNVPGIECFWEGRYVMAATIDNGGTVLDTFVVRYTSTDTLFSGPYKIILDKVFPETRTSMEPLDPSKYSFEVIVK